MDSIDKLLAQIKAEYQESDLQEQPKKQQIPAQPIDRSPSQKESSLDILLNQLEVEPGQIKQQQIQKTSKNEASLNSLLTDIKADYEAQAHAEEERRQEQLKAEELRKQQLKQQELEGLKRQAIAWLKKLEPLSTEGLWFEKFAENYSSRLEAAIVYLQDLQKNHH
ncbi:MAG TPA: hypothetical protein DEV81_19595 [Cyanobacteria bacterium UBA11049]|nr:hypothetical protein [Cyanobacteria bacterium UBA11049]